MSERTSSRSTRRTPLLSIAMFEGLAALASTAPARAAVESLPDPIHEVIASYETWAPSWFGPIPDQTAIGVTHGTGYSLPNLGPLPADADVDALADLGDGVFLFSLADWAELSGGVRVHPGDVIEWNGTNYSKVFDLLGCGFSAGLNVDAIDVSIYGNGTLLLSFDTTFFWLGTFFSVHTLFDEGYTTVAPFTCSFGDFAFYLSGSERRLDLDGLAFAARWGDPSRYEPYASFDTWAALGSSTFGPGDVAYRTFEGQWQAPALVPGFGSLPAREIDALVVQRAGLFADGFETGDPVRWSGIAP